MWTLFVVVLFGVWLFLQATAGDLGGRIVSWAAP